MKLPIYMDHHATTPVDPRVLQAMMPYWTTEFGNAASIGHLYGQRAADAAERSRAEIAAFLHAKTREVVITSGATESNNMVLKGIVASYAKKGNHLITQVTEHKSILDTCRFLEQQGIRVTYLPVDSMGRVNPEDVKKAITDKTVLISIMVANNEIGTIQPIGEIGKAAREHGAFFHVDAAQAAGKLKIDLRELPIDLLSFSAHKMYGPKGIGALFVRSENPYVRLLPLLHGGGQEAGMRSGTLNVPSLVGFGTACKIAEEEMESEGQRLGRLRDRLWNGLEREIDGVTLNGHPTERLPHNLNVSFACVETGFLLGDVHRELAISSGSACNSENMDASYVLKTLHLPGDRAFTAVRFGLGRFTTEEEVDFVIQRVSQSVKKIREHSPLYKSLKAEKTAH